MPLRDLLPKGGADVLRQQATLAYSPPLRYPNLPDQSRLVAQPTLEGANVWDRPIYRHPDGKGYGTTESFSFLDDKDNTETLVPMIINGKRLTQAQAVRHYRKTGEHLGKFKAGDYDGADAYGQALHEMQAQYVEQRYPTLGRR